MQQSSKIQDVSIYYRLSLDLGFHKSPPVQTFNRNHLVRTTKTIPKIYMIDMVNYVTAS